MSRRGRSSSGWRGRTPPSPSSSATWPHSHNNIGVVLRETGKPAEALAAYEQARAILERLARENPTVTEFQADLAESHNNIGLCSRDTGKPAEALAAYEQARAILRAAGAEHPESPDYASDLGGTP